MRNFLLTITAFSTLCINAQSIKRCHTDEVMNDYFASNPVAKIAFLKSQQVAKTQDSIAYLNGYQNFQSKLSAAPIYTIPVVFHVLHTGGVENISDAQIFDAMAILNKDYQKLNADTVSVVPQFKNLIGDIKFEFRLATKDPSGNCTTGITRHNDTRTTWTKTLSDYIYTWPPSQYLNIYVVKSIAGGTAAAYTFLTGTAPSVASDCIVSLHDYVGSIGTSNAYSSRTLTHEIGHWMNLPHVWGGTNNAGVACGDDGVSDTPITKGYLSCPSGTAAVMICNSGIVENYQNYMDYSYCNHMFTIGQGVRMTNAILSSVAQRNNLSTVSNLNLTGVTSPISNCAPVADFHSVSGSYTNLYSVCSGQSLTFVDDSYNGTVTTRSWSATGGAIAANPGNASTSISFPTPGTQTVTLFIANSSGSSTATKTVNVINGVANYNLTYQEGFEPVGLPANWSVLNPSGGVAWSQYFGAAATGNGSYHMNNSVNPNNAVDILETPSYDFLNNPGATYTFKYAYAKYSATSGDVFKVQASNNCGGTWQDIYVPTNSILASGSGGTTTTPFYPTPSQYKLYTLTSHPGFNGYKLQPNVRIRFYFMEDPLSGFGNNFFLDDINFNAPMGVNELTQSIGFNVFPNPTSGSASIEFSLNDNSEIKYNVTDVTGRLVEQERKLNLAPGQHSLIINQSGALNAGIYLVNFELNGQKMSRKLIVE